MEQTLQQINEVITPAELLKHWKGHRGLTRRVIEAFPEKEFFEFSIGGMRTFAQMTLELLGIAAASIREIASDNTSELSDNFEHGNKKENVLRQWDKDTEEITRLFAEIPAERFHETIKLFGKYEGLVWSNLFYVIDNEIHHRAQGYVYLRALGVEPPPFWDRF
jgi:uncharacterized damage-inducible protein DinB